MTTVQRPSSPTPLAALLERDNGRATPTPSTRRRSPFGLWNGAATTTDDIQATRALERREVAPRFGNAPAVAC
ncbi:MAG: hypothetical protein MI924_14040 [Chloroflexales bacterium]|nr:hypothetical protein [Chloroflexales bacterium]